MVTNQRVSNRSSMATNLVGGLVGGLLGGAVIGIANHYLGAPFVFAQMCGYVVLPQVVIVGIEVFRNRISKVDAAVKVTAMSVAVIAGLALTQLL